MPSATTTLLIPVVLGPLAAVDADLLVVPWFEDDHSSAVTGLDSAVGGELTRALACGEFLGRKIVGWRTTTEYEDLYPAALTLAALAGAALWLLL